jgi:hypothetical protein
MKRNCYAFSFVWGQRDVCALTCANMSSPVAVLAGRTKRGKEMLIAKALGGEARPRVGDEISYLVIDVACPLWERMS